MNVGNDQIGDIAILNFHDKYLWIRRWLYARKVLKNRNINVVLEKVGFVSGELRKTKTRRLAGEKRKETIHNENGCQFFLDVDKTYFSPRLSNERRVICSEIADKIKKGQKVLVMFAGIAPFPIVLGRMLKSRSTRDDSGEPKNKHIIVSSELNKDACKFAEKNVRLNKLQDYVKIVQGDSRKLKLGSPRDDSAEPQFDYIIMTRPNLKDAFLKDALRFSKKGTKIYYYGFGTEEEVLGEIKKDSKGKIGKIKIRKAGDIAPGKWRWLAEFSVK